MPHGDTTPLWLLATIAFILIMIVLWMYLGQYLKPKEKLSLYFAQRRHIRRMRNQGKQVLGDARHRRA